MLASLPGVLYETPAHPSGIENIFARRMVLASGSLRFPLSGLACAEVAASEIRCARVPAGSGWVMIFLQTLGARKLLWQECSRGCRVNSLLAGPAPRAAGR